MLDNVSNNSLNITTAATTLVVTGACSLVRVNVNSKGTVASTIKVYDGIDATGKLLATIDSLNQTGSYVFGALCAKGICLVTTGTVAPDVTVCWIR